MTRLTRCVKGDLVHAPRHRYAGAMRPWSLLLPLVGALACGEPRPRLPPPLPAPGAAASAAGDAARGAALLRDRALGRSGLACADCHRVPGDPADHLRPAPSLVGVADREAWWSHLTTRLATAVDHCAERYQAPPAHEAIPLADVVTALEAGPLAAPAARTFAPLASSPSGDAARGETLYRAGCAHCHEGGPAGPLRHRPWRAATVAAAVRGEARGPHPPHLRLMPTWPREVLDDRAVADLARALNEVARDDDTRRRE